MIITWQEITILVLFAIVLVLLYNWVDKPKKVKIKYLSSYLNDNKWFNKDLSGDWWLRLGEDDSKMLRITHLGEFDEAVWFESDNKTVAMYLRCATKTKKSALTEDRLEEIVKLVKNDTFYR